MLDFDALADFYAALMRGEALQWPFDHAPETLKAVLEDVRFHGIALVLIEARDAAASLPSELYEALLEEAQMQVFWEESHRATMTRVLCGLAASEIPALVMKGSALAYAVYPKAAMRRRGDTDLLVREGSLSQTRHILRETGFALRDNPHGLFFQETWLFDTGFGMMHALDLHWQPADSAALQNVLRIDEYFQTPEPLVNLAPEAQMPQKVLTFMQGAMNQAWHRARGYMVEDDSMVGGERLIWALDNHLLAQQFSAADWTRLAQLGANRGVAAIVLSALTAAQRDLHTHVPAPVLARLQAAPQDTALTRYIGEDSLLRQFRTDLSASRGWPAKARFVLANAFSSREHLQRKYPRAAHWPVPMLHARRLAEAALRAAGIKAR